MKVNCTIGETIEPVRFIPPLWTGNGFGYTLYGGDEKFQDNRTGIQYSIETCYFCCLWIPLYPIARYAVSLSSFEQWGHSTHGGSKATYKFVGQLPWNTTNYIHYLVSVSIIACLINSSNSGVVHSGMEDLGWSFLFSLWFEGFARVPFLVKILMFGVLYFLIKGYYTIRL